MRGDLFGRKKKGQGRRWSAGSLGRHKIKEVFDNNQESLFW